MVVFLKDQICEWANTEFGPRAMELARKRRSEDALQDTLAEFLKKDGEKPSPYKDLKHLHGVILRSMQNRHIDIIRKTSKILYVGDIDARSDEARSDENDTKSNSAVDERLGEEATGVFRSAILDLEPLDRIVLLVDRGKTARDVLSGVDSSSTTIIFDPDMLGLVQDAAAGLEPPVSASEAGAWTTLEEVARSLRQSAGTLRSRRHRVYAKLQRSLEDRGDSFEQWNQFAFDR